MRGMPTDGATQTVLVVDDDPEIRDTLVDVLGCEGFHVATAADGLEALDYLEANPSPRLILLDWTMPRCDGLTFRTRQLEHPVARAVPVVTLSADVRASRKANELGIDCNLVKPVDLEDLLEVISRYCGSE